MITKILSIICLSFLAYTGWSKTISLKQFGATGNGKTNDQDAFVKAADYINKLGGKTTLFIPSGTYLIGKQQTLKNEKAFLGTSEVLALKNCSNVTITGAKGVIIKYVDGLKFGAFNPNNGAPFASKAPFYDRRYTAQIGAAISLSNCRNITITGLNINGNSDNMIIGGMWGDVGYQLSHYGIFISNCEQVNIKNCHIHHLALDGISVSTTADKNNKITLTNCQLTYNGRCGLSWIGGNGLQANNCSFSFTGKGKISSSPNAGVDIESENTAISNGQFTNCNFINNAACGLLADSGPSRDVTLTGCTFWGVTNWSIWIKKPNYTFTRCNIYGSFVHGYSTSKKEEATKFYYCVFEDKPYLQQGPFGNFLAECDGLKLMVFDHCTFTSRTKKTIWFSGSSNKDEEKALFTNCTFNVYNNNIATGDFYGVIRKANIQNTVFNYYFNPAKKYYLADENNIKLNLKVNKLSK